MLQYLLFILAKHVTPLQGKVILHWFSDLFLNSNSLKKKILELVGCFDSSASVEHTNLMIIINVPVC